MKKICFLLFFSTALFGQQPSVVFLRDSVKTGEEVKVSMSYKHPSGSAVVFPDSSSDYGSFVFVSSEFFPTVTQKNTSKDSVVYTLVSYELGRKLGLRLFVLDRARGVRIFSDSATVFREILVGQKDIVERSPKVSLKFFHVPEDVNIPKITYYVVGFLVAVFLLFVFLGKWLKKKYILWKYNSQHRKFVLAYKRRAMNPNVPDNIRKAISEWKSHMEWLDRKPVSTMSTSEITELYQNERLEKALKVFDMAIYGGVVMEQIPFAYNILLDFATNTYRIQKKELAAKLSD